MGIHEAIGIAFVTFIGIILALLGFKLQKGHQKREEIKKEVIKEVKKGKSKEKLEKEFGKEYISYLIERDIISDKNGEMSLS